MNEITFSQWLQDQLDKIGISQADLARKAGTTRSAINGVITGTRGAGPELCTAIADALGYSPEVVFRAAGLLPPDRNRTPEIDAVIEAMNDLPEAWQARIAEDARRTRQFYEQQEQLRLERERQLLAGKRDTGKLPNLP